eukprot:COSAG04_NODE_2087_length_4828_cov_15.357418_1_plen_138_part_10
MGLVAQFIAERSTDEQIARRHLEAAGWDLGQAERMHEEEEIEKKRKEEEEKRRLEEEKRRAAEEEKRRAGLVAQFIAERSTDEQTARRHLEAAGWDLGRAERMHKEEGLVSQLAAKQSTDTATARRCLKEAEWDMVRA